MRGVVLCWCLWGCTAPDDDPAIRPVDTSMASGDTAAIGSSGDTATLPATTPPTEPEVPPCTDPPDLFFLTEPGARWDQGDPATMVHGIQGGWHIGLTGDAHGPQTLDVAVRITQVSTGIQLAGDDNDFRMRLLSYDDEACEGTLTGMIAYLDDPGGVDQPYICSRVGEELHIWLSLTDPETGRSDSEEVTVVAVADPDDDCSGE